MKKTLIAIKSEILNTIPIRSSLSTLLLRRQKKTLKTLLRVLGNLNRLPAELMYQIPFFSKRDRTTTLKHFVTQSFSSDDSDKSQVLSLFCRKSNKQKETTLKGERDELAPGRVVLFIFYDCVSSSCRTFLKLSSKVLSPSSKPPPQLLSCL